MAILNEKVGLTNEDIKKIRSMRPGRPVDLQLTTVSTTKRVRTEFVGMDGTRCIILKFPDEVKWGGLGDAIFKDKTMVLRYILEDYTGEIIAFKVKVTLILTKPSHLIFTSFPLAIQSQDLRCEPRVKTHIPAQLMDVDTGTTICKSLIIDISVNGCRIKVEKGELSGKMRLKQSIRLDFPNVSQSLVDLKGTIMNHKADEVSLYCGIKFEFQEKDVSQLLQYLMSDNK